jgi:TnpA family transposase
MPRREVLTPAERESLVAFPTDESELIRHYTLNRLDRTFVRQHRGAQNWLGIAVQLCYLRHPGRALGVEETPPPSLLGLVAVQLKVSAALWDAYARRDQTRREHQQELVRWLDLTLFTRDHYKELSLWLVDTALQTTQSIVLAKAVIGEIRRRRIVPPPIRVIELMTATAATRAQRQVYRLLTAELSAQQCDALDALLERRAGTPYSTLAWLRTPPGAPSAKGILNHIERLEAIRGIGLSPDIGKVVHQNRLLRIAREAAQTAVNDLRDYERTRRHATLVALLVETSATITDEIIELHDRIIGSFFAKAKHAYEQSFAESGQAINDKVRLFAKVGAALIAAKDAGTDPFASIEALMPWEEFTQNVLDADKLSRDASFDHLALLGNRYGQLRRYEPIFLETLELRGAPVTKPLLDAIDALKIVNASGARQLPVDVPTDFVRRRWEPHVRPNGEIDRKYYELCAMSELKNALRSGDVWVAGSRQFRDFDEYLLPRADYALRVSQSRLGLEIPTISRDYLKDRVARLRKAIDTTNALAAAGELPDAELTEHGLKVSPLVNAVPEAADKLDREVSARLPHVKITDLLLEVDRWTNFSRHFTHLKSGKAPKEPALLLTAVLADGINLGLTKMAEACPGTSLSKLSWLSAWHIRDETYSKALAELVNYQHKLPFAAYWGEGTTSSSDGQRYRAGGRGESAGHLNAHYGNDPGVLFYTHVSDQYAPFYTKVINAAVRDALHVLDGLLYHESDLRIQEHYTDTGGFTDHVFALCHLLGFRFAPRIRDLADTRVYVPDKADRESALGPLIGGVLNQKLIEQQFDEVLRLVASIKHGTVTASLIMRKLAAYPRQNSLALALREIGRIERTLFTLEWLQDPTLRRRVNDGLNKGEARNALARAVFFYRLGEIRDRSYENQRYRASGLNLIVAAITLWNTVYIQRAVDSLRLEHAIDDGLLQHLSPLGWEHVHLTGDYVWHANRRVAKGRYRALRTPKSSTANG